MHAVRDTADLKHVLADLRGRPAGTLGGTMAERMLLSAGAEVRAYDGVLLSPGPGTPEDAGVCMDIVRECAGVVPIAHVGTDAPSGEDLRAIADADAVAAATTDAVGGFFCDGELGPVSGRTHLHTYTASLVLFDAPRA